MPELAVSWSWSTACTCHSQAKRPCGRRLLRPGVLSRSPGRRPINTLGAQRVPHLADCRKRTSALELRGRNSRPTMCGQQRLQCHQGAADHTLESGSRRTGRQLRHRLLVEQALPSYQRQARLAGAKSVGGYRGCFSASPLIRRPGHPRIRRLHTVAAPAFRSAIAECDALFLL